MKKIVKIIEKDFKLLALNLMDSTLLGNKHNFISGTLVSLSSMVNLELPQFNVLTKIDLIKVFYD